MKTQLLMILSAVFMGLLGLFFTFAPTETLIYAGVAPTPLAKLLVQIAGALYLGFAMLNWMARGNLMGGIYSRPVAVGNLFHFAVVTLAAIRFAMGTDFNPVIFVPMLCYGGFAMWFGLVMFTHPVKR